MFLQVSNGGARPAVSLGQHTLKVQRPPASSIATLQSPTTTGTAMAFAAAKSSADVIERAAVAAEQQQAAGPDPNGSGAASASAGSNFAAAAAAPATPTVPAEQRDERLSSALPLLPPPWRHHHPAGMPAPW